MKTFSFAFAPLALVLLTGCPEKIFAEPEVVVVDYGQEHDIISGDLTHVDSGGNDTGGRDAGQDPVEPADIVQDTGPCKLICSAFQRCGPDPCGTGECEPGCGGSTPVCNLETRQCEAEQCIPSCVGKVCGYDGCGGPCGDLNGKCQSPQNCNYTTGTCGTQCYPDCTGKACGDDGCGKTCPPGCPSGVECHADGYCINEGQCQKSSTELKCQADENSGSGDTAWNIGTTTMALYKYSAECGSTFNPGPEKSFKFVVGPGDAGVLEVEISQSLPLLANFLNVYLIEDTGNGCTAASCVASGSPAGSSTKTFQYDVPASPTGHTYYLVADANTRNNGVFTITIKKCTWNGFDDDAVVTADQ